MSNHELRKGDLVEVESPAAILATLDERGALEGLPFMPEMAALCGRRFRVDRRAEKVCDTVAYSGSRRVPGTVLLDDLRCDGSAHGGCEAECRMFWKERWLRRVTPEAPPTAPFPAADLEALVLRGRRNVQPDEGGAASLPARWSCQSTELPRASGHLPLWDARSYVREYTSGNVPIGRFLRVTARAAVTEPMRKLGLTPAVHVKGTSKTAAAYAPLNLQPGEIVQVKSKEEIAATLTPEGRHRGLWFDNEMVPACGRTFRVRRRVRRFIDERDGRMVELKNDCLTLEGSVCSGELSPRRWFCPRAIYSYWRECWLRRVNADGTAEPPAAAGEEAALR